MQDATAKVCTAVQLDNGEQLPTLQQYLDKAKSLKTRLILELKAHKTPEQETRAVEGIVKMIKDKGLEDRKRSQRHGMAHQPRSRFHHNQ